MKYDIVRSSDIHSLVQEVNDRIEDGWIPCGSVFVYTGYCQPMTKDTTPYVVSVTSSYQGKKILHKSDGTETVITPNTTLRM